MNISDEEWTWGIICIALGVAVGSLLNDMTLGVAVGLSTGMVVVNGLKHRHNRAQPVS